VSRVGKTVSFSLVDLDVFRRVFSLLCGELKFQTPLISYIKHKGHTHRGTLAKDIESGSERGYLEDWRL
jgi:hypothetical protein